MTSSHSPPILQPPFPTLFASAAELLTLCQQAEVSIAHLILSNERQLQPDVDIEGACYQLWQVMDATILRGSQTEGDARRPIACAASGSGTVSAVSQQ